MNVRNGCGSKLCIFVSGDIVGIGGYYQSKGLWGIAKNRSHRAGLKIVLKRSVDVEVNEG